MALKAGGGDAPKTTATKDPDVPISFVIVLTAFRIELPSPMSIRTANSLTSFARILAL